MSRYAFVPARVRSIRFASLYAGITTDSLIKLFVPASMATAPRFQVIRFRSLRTPILLIIHQGFVSWFLRTIRGGTDNSQQVPDHNLLFSAGR